MLQGHKPSHYQTVRPFPPGRRTCYYGQKTIAAVAAAKYKLGFPTFDGRRVGNDFLEILRGRRARPPYYLVRATERLARHQAIEAQAATSRCAQRLVALEDTQIGVHEIPDGSNRGARISYPVGAVPSYQSSTGAYGLAWCASFQAWAYRLTHIGYPKAWNGYLADSEASQAAVFRIVRAAQARGWARAVPKPGYLVAYVDGQGHIELVERVFSTGWESIGGNVHNSVRESWHAFGSRPVVFIQIPGCNEG